MALAETSSPSAARAGSTQAAAVMDQSVRVARSVSEGNPRASVLAQALRSLKRHSPQLARPYYAKVAGLFPEAQYGRVRVELAEALAADGAQSEARSILGEIAARERDWAAEDARRALEKIGNGGGP